MMDWPIFLLPFMGDGFSNSSPLPPKQKTGSERTKERARKRKKKKKK